MSELIKSQSFHIIVMCSSGMLFMIIWEIASWARRALSFGRASASFLEIILWIFQSFIASAFLYYCAYGRLSVHCLIFFIAGIVLWNTFFSGIIRVR